MPRYFFHCEGTESFTDRVGNELPDEMAAREQAIINAAEILKHHAPKFTSAPRWRFFVLDEQGRTVFALRLSLDEDALP